MPHLHGMAAPHKKPALDELRQTHPPARAAHARSRTHTLMHKKQKKGPVQTGTKKQSSDDRDPKHTHQHTHPDGGANMSRERRCQHACAPA